MTTWDEYNQFLGNVRVKAYMKKNKIQFPFWAIFYKLVFGIVRGSWVLERAPSHIVLEGELGARMSTESRCA
jgi:hypothetical protein